jgi:hypothetical protein
MPGDAAAPPAVTAAGDPFGGTGEPMSDDSAPRLAGTIRDARAALALFESGNGKFSTVAPGDARRGARDACRGWRGNARDGRRRTPVRRGRRRPPMSRHAWWAIVLCAGLDASAAQATLPPLPPLPPSGWPIASISLHGADVPLPQGAPDGPTVAADAPARAPAEPAPFDAAARTVHDAGASASWPPQQPVLEGPPIPLPPPTRMNDPAARHAGDADDARRISLNLQGAALAAAFDALARFTGLNIIVGEQVRGTVTLRLNNVRWRDAFDTLLDTHGLAMSRRGNVIWVTPAAELAARERER